MLHSVVVATAEVTAVPLLGSYAMAKSKRKIRFSSSFRFSPRNAKQGVDGFQGLDYSQYSCTSILKKSKKYVRVAEKRLKALRKMLIQKR